MISIRFNKFYISLLIFTHSFNLLFSQHQTIVTVSTDKVSIDGKQYYIHKVENGHSLHSISKAYQVSEEDIIKNNPSVHIGLQVGQSLKIPIISSKNMLEKKENNSIYNNTDSLYVFHVTKPGETIYSLSKIYQVSEDTIKALNPKLKEILKSGSVVKIPELGPPTDDWELKVEEKVIKHHVKKGENLISIARLYGVPIANINKHNKWGSVKKGNYINIAITDSVLVPPSIMVEQDTSAMDTVNLPTTYFDILTGKSVVEINQQGISNNRMSKSLDIALLLPFKYNKIAELNSLIDTCEVKDKVRYAKRQRKRVKINSNFYTDFYFGCLLALDSIKKTGINVNLSVFDTQADSNIVRYTINKYNLKNFDLVIGPAETSEINMLLEYLGNTNVRIVLPINGIKDTTHYNNVFQAIPSNSVQKEHLANYVGMTKDKNIILLSGNDSLSIAESFEMKNMICSYIDYYGTYDSCQIKEISYTDTLILALDSMLCDSISNILVIISKDRNKTEALLSNITRELYFMEGDYDISLIGNPGWIDKLENINIFYLHKLNLTYYFPFYIDYKKENVINFLHNFREKYKSEPSYSLSGINPTMYGYDIMMYFAGKPFSNQKNQRNKQGLRSQGLLSDYEFIQKNPGEAYENISVIFISYDRNFEVVSFKPYDLYKKKGEIMTKTKK